MNVLICVNNSLRYCPYINLYIKICEDKGYSYTVIYPDRGNLKEQESFPTIRFDWDKKKNGAIQLLQYSRFARRILLSNTYDFAIVITTGAAVLLSKALLSMHGKYIIDIRDYTRENNWLYYQIEKRVIEKARCAIVSSPYFKAFLPNQEYLFFYNMPATVEEVHGFKKKEQNPIIISYIGTIAYPEQCEYLMNLVEKDSRFRFFLYGNDLNGNRISNYITEKGYKHSKYLGPYMPADKEKIIRKADILFNAYGNNSIKLKNALSNKLTDAAIYKKVVLNSPGTCMDKELKECSFAIDLEHSNNLNNLYEWYISLDPTVVDYSLHNLLLKILKTNRDTEMRIIQEISKSDIE